MKNGRILGIVLLLTAVSSLVCCEKIKDIAGLIPDDMKYTDNNLGYVKGGDKDIIHFVLGNLVTHDDETAFAGWGDDSFHSQMKDTLIIKPDTVVLSNGDTLFQAADTIIIKDIVNSARKRLDYYTDFEDRNKPHRARNRIPVYIKYTPDDANIRRVTLESSDTNVIRVSRSDRPLKFFLEVMDMGDCNITVTLEGNNIIRKTYPVRCVYTAYIIFYISRLSDLIDNPIQWIDYKVTTMPDKWYPFVMYVQDSLTLTSICEAEVWDAKEFFKTGKLVNKDSTLTDTVTSRLRSHVEVITRAHILKDDNPMGMIRLPFRDISSIAARDIEKTEFFWRVKQKDHDYEVLDYDENGELIWRDTTIVHEKIRLKGYKWKSSLEMGVDVVCGIPYVDFKSVVKLKGSLDGKTAVEVWSDAELASDEKALKALRITLLDNPMTGADRERLEKAAEETKKLVEKNPRDSAKWLPDFDEYGIDIDYVFNGDY